MELKGKRILITGAGGYVGGRLADSAQREGASVRVLIRSVEPHMKEWLEKFDVVCGDVTQKDVVLRAVAGSEVVWHCASANETVCQANPKQALEVNVAATLGLLEAAAASGVERFIKFSTFHVYGAADGEQITESTVAMPRSLYGLHNLMGDEAAAFFGRQSRMSVVIPRLSNGYGVPLFCEVKRWSLVVNDLCRMVMERGEITLKGSGLAQRDFVALEDVYSAVKKLTLTPSLPATFFHVGGGESISIGAVAELVRSQFEKRTGRLVPYSHALPTDGEISRPVHFDISCLREMGWQPQNRMALAIDQILDLIERKHAA